MTEFDAMEVLDVNDFHQLPTDVLLDIRDAIKVKYSDMAEAIDETVEERMVAETS